MGWTSYNAYHYKTVKGRRVVDRKAECDYLFKDEDSFNGKYRLKNLKSAIVGSTYYAAIEQTEIENPENRSVTAVVCLTSMDMKDHFNFAYKDMTENSGPYKYDCPKGILDLLTPTDNEWANKWRELCREKIAKKKDPNALRNLPVGTKIKVVMPFDTTYHKKGQEVILIKCLNLKGNRTAWYKGSIKFTAGLMKYIEEVPYEIVSTPNREEQCK